MNTPSRPQTAFAPAWLSDAGGLRYHLRALRHRNGAWRPFRAQVARWLEAWAPPGRELALVGPSAGHTLPPAWFARFDRVTVFEPDPFARRWLARRLSASRLHFSSEDVLGGAHPLETLNALPDDCAILFCNVLGQVAPEAAERWHAPLRTRLGERDWASFHDVVSTDRPPRADAPDHACAEGSLEAILARFWSGGELPLVDHDTFQLDGSGSADYTLWHLRPGRFHLVEWVTHRSPSQKSGATA
ncbi:MAG: hypothetical protein KDH20_06985 [Rhodocyclaceae bacterium]|nr:hypothetical protein [Rhodocyclaceae bacterium]